MNINGKLVHIFNSHGIGDVIMTLPMTILLLNKGAKLVITVKGKTEALVIKSVLGDESCKRIEFVYFSQYEGIKGLATYIQKLRNFQIDISMPVTGIHNDKYTILALLSNAKYRVGLGGRLSFFNHKNLGIHHYKHKVEKNLEIVSLGSDFKLNPNHVELPTYKEEPFCLRIDPDKGGKIIALAPSSGKLETHKRWPIESYRELAQRLIKKGNLVVILGGPGEEALGNTICDGLNPELLRNYIGKLSIKESLDCLAQCDVLVANCNGLSHMGSIISGLKVIGLYGPTNPEVTGPYKGNFVSIRANMKCSPCYKRGYIQGCGNPLCMKNISVKQVEKIVLSH